MPFVDAVVTMADDSIPLVANELDEWGDPNEVDGFKVLAAYSPMDNIKRQPYPPMLLEAGLWDTRVGYWEAAKFAQRLREKSTSASPILLRCDMGEGHGCGGKDRYKYVRDVALVWAFILHHLGAAHDPLSPLPPPPPPQA